MTPPLPATSRVLSARRGYLDQPRGVRERCPAWERFRAGERTGRPPPPPPPRNLLIPPPLLRSPRTARRGKQSGGRLHYAKLGHAGLSQTGQGSKVSGSSLVRIFAITFGSGDDFRAEFSSSHWLGLQNNYDHILILLAGAYCLLVVKDLLSIHQPPIFANYILLK